MQFLYYLKLARSHNKVIFTKSELTFVHVLAETYPFNYLFLTENLERHIKKLMYPCSASFYNLEQPVHVFHIRSCKAFKSSSQTDEYVSFTNNNFCNDTHSKFLFG